MGFGSGIERIILEMQKNGVVIGEGAGTEVFVVHRTEAGLGAVFALAGRLRAAGLAVVLGESGRSFKSQLRSANSSGARFAVIIGDDELASGAAVVKDLRSDGEQSVVSIEALPVQLTAHLRPG
jgi:histidyl-tRNA synthetase